MRLLLLLLLAATLSCNAFAQRHKEPSPAVGELSELPRGTRVGAVLGFVHPDIEPLLADGSLIRDDAVDQEKTLLKLSLARFQYAVTDSFNLDWYLKQIPNADLSKWQLPINRASPISCGVSKTARTDPAALVAAINRLRDSGAIAKIIARYK